MTNRPFVFLRRLSNSLPATIRSILSIGIGDAVSKLILFAAFVHIARVLTPERFGEWNLAIALSALLVPVVDFGLGLIGTREVAKEESSFSHYYVHITLLRMIFACASFALLILILSVSNISPQVFTLSVLFGLTYFLLALSATWAYQAKFRPGWFISDKIIQTGVFAILVLLLFEAGTNLVWLPLFAVLSLGASVAVLLGGFVRRHFVRPIALSLRSFIRKHGSSMLSLFSVGILSQLHVTIGYVVVGAFLGVADVGEYSAAFRIFSVLLIFPNLLWSSFYPLLSRGASSPTLWTRSFGVMMRYQWAAVWFFVAIATWYPTEFLSLLYAERYMGSRGLLQILLLSLSASFLSMALLRTLPALGRERQSLMILAVATAIHLPLATILTLDRGIIGAGLALLVTELFSFGAILLLWPDFRKGITNGASLFMGCGLLSFLGLEGLQIIVEINRMTGFLLATIVYVVLVLRIGKLSLKQITELESTYPAREVFKSA